MSVAPNIVTHDQYGAAVVPLGMAVTPRMLCFWLVGMVTKHDGEVVQWNLFHGDVAKVAASNDEGHRGVRVALEHPDGFLVQDIPAAALEAA